MDKPKIIHRANKLAPSGDVSALCFKRPRAIILNIASWALEDERVTCPRCLELIESANQCKERDTVLKLLQLWWRTQTKDTPLSLTEATADVLFGPIKRECDECGRRLRPVGYIPAASSPAFCACGK